MAVLEDWLAELGSELGLDASAVDRTLVLNVARDVAHGIARPAAPLTTFLVGLAAGLRGGSAEEVRAAAETVQRLVADHAPDPSTES
jgi:Domain of unknown function (DUF6457)